MMYLRPRPQELRSIAYYTGQVVLLLGALMAIPLLTALVLGEWPVAVDFALSLGITVSAGFGLVLLWQEGVADLTWTQGLVVAAFSWLLAMALAGLPYYLSGYWLSYLDAMFDVMSGFTTTGLALAQDLDHLPDALNMWRFMLTWLGGQGMVVLALTFFVRSLPGAFKMYVGEAKDERLLPNVVHTARAIWYISLVYLLVGTLLLWGIGVTEGLAPGRSFLHGVWMSMSAWSTGGFAPQVQNLGYYHSFAYEMGALVLFVLGSMNFNLHWAVWTGNRRELFRNLEAVAFFVTVTILGALTVWELGRTGTYSGAVALFRRGYLQLISAHTTTGFGNIAARQLVLEWGPTALLAMTVAMLFGAFASSTAGGFKSVRIGLAFKSVVQDVRRLLVPERAVVVEKFHMGREVVLEDRTARAAMAVIIMYVALWGLTAMVTALHGYDIPSALFEAASVTGNVGLSSGVTTAGMPWGIKVTYIFAMWLARLEFTAGWVLVGYIYTLVRGR